MNTDARLRDRNGDPFPGTREELRRHNNKLCKQASRAKADPALSLPTPPGIAGALARICEQAGFEDPRELLSTVILKLDALRTDDRQQFDKLTSVTVSIGCLEKYLPLIGADPGDQEDDR